MKKSVKSKADILEAAVNNLAVRLYEHRNRMLKDLGPRPFLGQPLDSLDAFNEYLALRHNPQGWRDALNGTARVQEDGRVLVPQVFIDKVAEFEKKLREGDTNAG